jgi:hypothetical protein
LKLLPLLLLFFEILAETEVIYVLQCRREIVKKQRESLPIASGAFLVPISLEIFQVR